MPDNATAIASTWSDLELPAWLAVLGCPGVGPSTVARLLRHCGRLSAVPTLSRQTLLSLGIAEPLLKALQQPDEKQVETQLNWARAHQCALLTWRSPDYPPLLTQIPQAPPLLYVQGDLALLSRTQLAIVGSRYPTANGWSTAHQFAYTLSQAKLVITSGLALGIDGASHQGALAAEGETIAVLGAGLAKIYPKSHQALADKIRLTGALVSEFSPYCSPKPMHFPQRNRIISGLSKGVLVVEASQRSGSLITARLAAEQGREVFALPGSIFNPRAMGCHQLIRNGATLVASPLHILEEITGHSTPPSRFPHESQLACLTSAQQRLLLAIDHDFTPIDCLQQRTGLTTGELSSMLLQLELSGYVQQMAGGYGRLAKNALESSY